MAVDDPPPARPQPAGRTTLVAVSLVVLVLVGGLVTLVVAGPDGATAPSGREAGIPAAVPTSLAGLMQLSPLPARPAPDFTLTDQNGQVLSRSGFGGRAEVLEFMDSHCTDICPIISQEFVDAYHDLGPDAAHVVFLAVNVNPFHAAVTDMASFTDEHQLDTIPSWHFLTGPTDGLRAVWSSYGVSVDAPGPDADVIHSSFVYFIGPNGEERYIGSPQDDHRANGDAYLPGNQIAAWGKGIAAVARSMLP